jgi:hypothetical protein
MDSYIHERQARDWAYMLQYEHLDKEDRKTAITEFTLCANALLNNCNPIEKSYFEWEIDGLRRKIGA